ncbi:hypothetical protein MLD38_016487 [Melastoma candidum]|uniref:Uncharacterized protein n=1 Tax=Melastoma candidum TaxID=119954 RepID=A0ACB9QR28_9MYRT|nr:hypothetical protein MLD38_016487 [Melastoma candidum]
MSSLSAAAVGEEGGIDGVAGVHLISAFLAMEPTRCLLSHAKNCGGGSVSLGSQRFIWDHCISKNYEQSHAPYVKNFVKKLLSEIESDHGEALDELYELYADYVTSIKEDDSVKGNSWTLKHISFLFPDASARLVVPLQCSLNMLEGDTGCSIWPSSLYLSELILSHPEHFSGKSCFEVGSGVGLVGVCLAQIKASRVILTDGDPSSLANLEINLKLNGITPHNQELDSVESTIVKCVHLPWELAMEYEVQDFSPDIILGADVIYDPLCLPHLVRLLTILLHPKEPSYPRHILNHKSHKTGMSSGNSMSRGTGPCSPAKSPDAYISSVIRNAETFNQFLLLADQANIAIQDITETFQPLDLLPYLQSYDRSSIRLFKLSPK